MIRSKYSRGRLVYITTIFAVPIIYILSNLRRTNGLFFPPDEIGYWENTAQMLGLDWSGACFMQSYYAKGYSLLLLPLTKFFSSPLSMYNGALVINSFLFGMQAWVLLLLLEELHEEISEKELCLIALACVFYPAHFVYMNYTIAESLLYLLLSIVFWQLKKYENCEKIHNAVIVFASSVALVLTHFRTIGVAVVAVIAVFLIRGKETIGIMMKRCVLGICITFSVVIMIVSAFQIHFGFEYIDEKLDRIQMLFNFDGLLSTVMGFLGQTYYICVATLGLFLFFVLRVWRRRKDSYFESAVFVSIIISIFISAVFFVNQKGLDFLVYGRYTEIFAPIIACLGLCELNQIRDFKSKALTFFFIVLATVSVALILYAASSRINVYRRDFILGLSWIFGQRRPMINQLIGIPTILCIIFLWFVKWLSKSGGKKKTYIPLIFTVVFMIIGLYMSEICVYDYHEYDKADVELFEKITSMYDDGREVVFLRPPGVNYIGHLQFYMFDRTINYIDGTPEDLVLNEDDIVVTYHNYEKLDVLKNTYEISLESPHFVVLYDG